MKEIYSERKRQDIIKQHGKRYKELDLALISLKIDCSKRRLALLNIYEYAFNGSIIDFNEIPEDIWLSIPPSSMGEKLFKEVCKKSGK